MLGPSVGVPSGAMTQRRGIREDRDWAVQLLVDYLFGAKKEHRIHLVIVPENAASRRIAEKCGFIPEGTVRGAFFNDGRNQDVLLYSLLRTDPRPWRGAVSGQ